MRMSGLASSVSTLFVISALAGSIYLAEVSVIQQLMYLAFIICFQHDPSLFAGQKLALLVEYRLLPVQL